jgi:RND superfamily putative drug exporter
MAELLYRLGHFSARRAWLVIVTWILLLAATVTAMGVAGGKLSTAMSIDGIPSQVVIDELKKSFPAASHGNASVVFHAKNGEFTDSEIAAIGAELKQVAKLPGVNTVVDPFKVQSDKDHQISNLRSGFRKFANGKQQIADGKKKLTDGQNKLDAAQKTVTDNLAKAKAGLAAATDGKAKAEAGLEQAQTGQAQAQAQAAYDQAAAAGAPAAQLAAIQVQIDQAKAGAAQAAAGVAQAQAGIDQATAGIKQLAAAQQTIDDNQAKITAGRLALNEAADKLPDAQKKLYQGQRILAATAAFRTVSRDNQTALAAVVFNKPADQVEVPQKNAIVAYLDRHTPVGVQVEFSKELTMSMEGILGVGEVVGLVVAGIVLFLMLGTFIGAGLPIMAAILGVGISATTTMALASVIEMTSTTPTLGVMLGLAIGIDYSLFILNRHRRQLKAGMDLRESIALANGTSGNAVFFAGLTVIIALVALNLTGIGFLGLMGDFAALSIFVGVLIAVTFTPAIISRMGLKVLSRRERRALAEKAGATAADGYGTTASGEAATNAAGSTTASKKSYFPAKHPWISILAAGAVLVIAAIPLASMRLGLPDGSSEPTDSTQYRAYTLATKAFGAGSNGMIVAVASLDQPVTGYQKLKTEADLATELMKLKDVSAVLPAAISPDNTKILFQVLPKTGPASLSTSNLVLDLRATSATLEQKFGATLGVTGLVASNIDVSKKLSDALPLYLGTVLVLSLIVLVLVFRSLLVPLIASVGFLLSVAATMGAVVAVYQWGWLGAVFGVHDPSPILSFLPTMLIGILFGLAMDYQLFLVSGMREAYVHGLSARDAVVTGARSGFTVVLAAASIMIFVFGGFAFSHLTQVRPIGLGLAVGVLADAFLVRMILVPALMSLLGKSAWWIPRWLDRILPDVDVEGAKLERTHHVH